MNSEKNQIPAPRLFGIPISLAVSLTYLIFGLLWIFFSDRIATTFSASKTDLLRFSSIKGWGFVLVTATGLYALLRHAEKKDRASRHRMDATRERLQIATKAGNIGVWDRDIVNDSLIWDERMYQIYGIREKDFGGAYEAWQQCLHPDDLNRAVAEVTAAERGEKPFDTEFRIIRPDGEIRHIRAFAKVIRYEDGNPIRMTGTNQDITERIKAEQKLKESEEKLRGIIENSTNLFYSHTPDHELTFLSPQVKEILGYAVDEALRRWTEMATDHPINEKGFELTERAIQTGKAQPTYELQLRHKDGRPVWVEVHEAPAVENGKTIAIVGSLTDITARKAAEKELAENEKRLRTIYEHSPISIWEEDFSGVHQEMQRLRSEGVKSFARYFADHPDEVPRFASLIRILDINTTGLELLDATSKEDILDNLDAYFDEKSLPAFRDELVALSNGETTIEIEISLPHPSRGHIDLYLRLQIVPGFEKDWSRVVVSFMDITERKKAEEELKNHTRQLEHFNKMAVGRELRMIELKKEINALCRELGRDEPYA